MLAKRSSFLRLGGAIGMLVLFVVFALQPASAIAADSLNTVGTTSGLGNTDLLTIIGNIINIFLGLLGVVFLVLTIYAGFLWMTSQGDEEVVTKAKNIIKSATIGLVLCLAAFAIATFVINLLTSAILGGDNETPTGPTPELFSDALGSGGIEDHYPDRNATDIARNTKILVTFKNQIYVPAFIVGYDVGEDATIVSDDTAPATANVNTGNFTLSCVAEDGTETTYGSTDITVSFTDDLKTFVFDPPILGSALAPTDCTVLLSSNILTATGGDAIGANYEWSFQVSTELDLTPPTVVNVIPGDGDSGYGRNITTQITFDEAVDPTTASGTYSSAAGAFDKIVISADQSDPPSGSKTAVEGTYVLSSGYKVVEFTPAASCGADVVNSCGVAMYCLPGPTDEEMRAGQEEEIDLRVKAASLESPVSSDAPAAANVPYTGVADLAGNALDGNDDGTAGDDYSESFSVTNEIVSTPPGIETVSPSVLEPDVNLDQSVVVLWDTFMRASTLTNAYVSIVANPDHEMSYVSRVATVDADGVDVASSGGTAVGSAVTIVHGTFLESIEDDPSTSPKNEAVSQLYYPILPDDIQSLYQNCFYPASGPGASESSTCDGTANNPNCCNGTATSTPFNQSTYVCGSP